MIEVYRGSRDYIAHTVYDGGTPREVDDEQVFVKIVNPFTNEEWTTTEATSLNLGRYQVRLPIDATKYDTTLKTYWTYAIDGEILTSEEDVEVITPYISVDEIVSLYPQLQQKNYEELRAMERKVRLIINQITGQDFGRKRKRVELNTNTSTFSLSERLWDIHYMGVNGQDVPSEYIKLINEGWAVHVTFPPGYYHVKSDTVWRNTRNSMSVVLHGQWGWPSVPNDINLAAGLLIGDYFCNDALYRQKGVQAVRAADWRLDFHDKAFAGTGNLDVDLLLSKYAAFNMVVI